MKTGVKVYDAMTKSPVIVKPDLSVKACANAMLRNKVGSLIIKKDDKIVGMLTEKDLIKIIAKKLNPEKIKVEKVMSKRLHTIDANTDLYDAIVRMRKKNVRRLPVIHKKKLIGLLTDKDILKIQPQLFDLLVEKYQIKEFKEKGSAERYIEGECESCNNYAQLYPVSGKLICEECKDLVTP